jgi:SAM-dependent methyltransferase
MHKSGYDNMALCVEHYMPRGRKHRVLEVGSRIADGQVVSHGQIFEGRDVEYVGMDIKDGRNVDVVMSKPYSIPAKSNSIDYVIAGQVFEHVPFPWALMLEIARVLKPQGMAFVTAPSRGHTHEVLDCWRYYPDAYRAMAAYTRLKLVEAFTDFPPYVPGKRRHDYSQIDVQRAYWGDSVGVFQKPHTYPQRRMILVRMPTRWWANRVGAVKGGRLPAPLPGRDRCGLPTGVDAPAAERTAKLAEKT